MAVVSLVPAALAVSVPSAEVSIQTKVLMSILNYCNKFVKSFSKKKPKLVHVKLHQANTVIIIFFYFFLQAFLFAFSLKHQYLFYFKSYLQSFLRCSISSLWRSICSRCWHSIGTHYPSYSSSRFQPTTRWQRSFINIWCPTTKWILSSRCFHTSQLGQINNLLGTNFLVEFNNKTKNNINMKKIDKEEEKKLSPIDLWIYQNDNNNTQWNSWKRRKKKKKMIFKHQRTNLLANYTGSSLIYHHTSTHNHHPSVDNIFPPPPPNAKQGKGFNIKRMMTINFM